MTVYHCLACDAEFVFENEPEPENLFCDSECEEQYAYYQGIPELPERQYALLGSDGERPMKGDDV